MDIVRLMLLSRQMKNRRHEKDNMVTGIPPLTFIANKTGLLKNYRIYGNTVNGESVGELVTDSQSGHYGKYAIPVTNNSETANIYLDEPLRKVGDEAEYVDYATQKWHRVRKNLFNIETDIIPLGFQYGAVAIFSDLNIKGFFKECEPNTAYTISRKTSSNNRFSIGFSAEEPPNNSSVALLSYTTPLDTSATSLTSISPANAKYICCYLSNQGDDITEALEIMLEKNDRATDYEPYIEDTEVDVILPGIAVTAGTNTLTVGTEVQPSRVELTGRIKEGES